MIEFRGCVQVSAAHFPRRLAGFAENNDIDRVVPRVGTHPASPLDVAVQDEFAGEEVPEGRDEYLPERPLRTLPAGGGLVEVTTRTIHGRFLIKPTPECKELAEGVVGRALWKYPEIKLVAYWFLSNHYLSCQIYLDYPPNVFVYALESGQLASQGERTWQ